VSSDDQGEKKQEKKRKKEREREKKRRERERERGAKSLFQRRLADTPEGSGTLTFLSHLCTRTRSVALQHPPVVQGKGAREMRIVRHAERQRRQSKWEAPVTAPERETDTQGDWRRAYAEERMWL